MASRGYPNGGYPMSGAPPLATAYGSPDDVPADPGQGLMDDSRSSPSGAQMSVHEANRVKKSVEQNAQAVQNRIQYMQREEEKIWRDLEEVRRQASVLEEGRARTVEKKLADNLIATKKATQLQDKQARAAATRQAVMEQRKQHQFATMQAKQVAGQDQRRQSAEIIRHKRMQEAQTKLANSEKTVAMQRNQLEAKMRVNQERAERLDRLRIEQEGARLTAQQRVYEASARLPDLEAEEMLCLQRLQNSRIVTQSVLQELESSLGASSSVAALLRSKQRQHQESLQGVAEDATTLADSPAEMNAAS